MVKVTGDALGIERFAVLDSTKPLPADLLAVEGVWGGKFHARVRLVPVPVYTNGLLSSPTQPDFTKLGVVLDLLRDAGLPVDLSRVPGWLNKGIGS